MTKVNDFPYREFEATNVETISGQGIMAEVNGKSIGWE